MVFTMGSDIRRTRVSIDLGKAWTTLATTSALLASVLLVGLVSDVSPQRTYQRACDCEYMLNGKCAYTLLLPTGANDGTCPGAGAGAGSEAVDESLRNITNRVDKLYEMAMDQSSILMHVQKSIIELQRNNCQPRNDSEQPRNDSEQPPVSSNVTQNQSTPEELDGLKRTTEMLARNLSTLRGLVESQMAELSNLQSVVNETEERLVNRTAADEIRDAKISQLSETVRLLRQESCIRRAALFSGPDRLNGTSINFSSIYGNDTAKHGPQQLAIDSTSAWCPGEPPTNEWVQFDIGREVLVFGIATRGRNDNDQWITTYNIQYVPTNSSRTSSGGSTLDWVHFKNVASENEVFQGNKDRSSIQLNMLWRPILTRYVRILPLTGYNGGNVCTRADIIGCVDEI